MDNRWVNAVLGILTFGTITVLGVCNYRSSQENKKLIQQIHEKDSIYYQEKTRMIKIIKNQEDSISDYSSSLKKVYALYEESQSEKEKIKKEFISIKNKYNFLEEKIMSDTIPKVPKKQYEMLIAEFEKLKNVQNETKNQLGKYQEKLTLYEEELGKYKTIEALTKESIDKLVAKVQPMALKENGILIKDTGIKDAFAIYPNTTPERREPLRKTSDSLETLFAYPLKFLDSRKGRIDIYVTLKDGSEIKKGTIYLSKGFVSTKKKSTDAKDFVKPKTPNSFK